MIHRSFTRTVALCAGLLSGVIAFSAAAQVAPGGMQPRVPTAAMQQAIQALALQVPDIGILREGDQIARVYGKVVSTGPSPHDSAQAFLQQHGG
ncbi:MAG: hypothetical protein JNK53_04570, partial [Phycisphaerae bacterium]|nr:hypothetical protein [Phycisphaerae bacterium]